ncbi:MAG: SUMF1/EgtB/PvdO family nonheme iron enzyme [Candidatus Lernaella stagnicola]|nr:SUMF1/EgtB/PvdO family nonheme iron enzyme [Candidatus Lernaella stagnicola]
MNRVIALLLSLALAGLACGCVKQLPESVYLKSNDAKGLFFGRVAPVRDVEEGWAKFRQPSGGTFKTGLDADGYFLAKASSGLLELSEFQYRDQTGVNIVTLARPYSFEVVPGCVSYVGVVVVSPLSRNVYLTDDFFRDRQWFTEHYGNDLTPQSSFANQTFYDLMEQYAAQKTPAPSATDGRVNMPTTTFLMGDVWPGDGVEGPGGVDLSQIPPHVVTVSAFAIDALPISAESYGLEGSKPVVRVTWPEAQAYCAGHGGRLPTEAELELATRGPAWGARYYGGAPAVTAGTAAPDGEIPSLFDSEAWPESDFGVRCNGKRLAEWTADWYSGATFRSGGMDPGGPASGTKRVVRAGSYRFALRPDESHGHLGFRCAYGGAPSAPTPRVDKPASSPAAPAPPAGPVWKTAVDVNLYAGPSLQAAVVARVAAGTVVIVAGRSDDFLWIRLPNGDEGFVPAEKLQSETKEKE